MTLALLAAIVTLAVVAGASLVALAVEGWVHFIRATIDVFTD